MINWRGNSEKILIVAVFAILAGCATYYQKNQAFQGFLRKGDFGKARELLIKDSGDAKGKNRMLYSCNRGWVDFALGNYTESIVHFNAADLYIEDFQKNYGSEALALISNPGVKPYAPEDPEKVMVNYYKAMAFLQSGKYEEALVEARRINQKLIELNDKYKGRKNRYADDAFAHILMGMIYDATFDYNNAFIAYRNAAKVYDSIYTPQFGLPTPNPLKQDILRTAWLTGFNDEVRFFEDKFKMRYQHQPLQGGYLVFVWENGFGPVKDEWSIMFTKIDKSGGWVTLQNDELGMSFPFFIGNMDNRNKSAFSDLSVFRVAFPKYLERPPFFQTASLKVNESKFSLEKAQDINAILFKTLEDRMHREMANSLLRLATKKAVETAVREGDKNVGAIVGLINAATEKADTRNWQTLPYDIHYTRIALPEGVHQISLETTGSQSAKSTTIPIEIKKGRTTFVIHRNLESYPEQRRYK
jgi:hypothetical protein